MAVKGDVKSGPPADPELPRVQQGNNIHVGHAIKTAEVSELLMSPFQGSAVRVLEKSSVMLQQLDLEKSGERVIGRKVSATWVANVLSSGAPELAPDAAFAALMEGRTVLELAEGLQLRRVRVMGAHRIELSGFTDTMRDRLRTYGLFAEIISWKLRMFVPTDACGVQVLAKVLERYAIERIVEREAA